MLHRKWQFRIRHILESIDKIQSYTNGMTLDTFVDHEMVIDAVIRNFTIIGEATRHVPNAIREKYPEVPWRLMQDMRNIVVHEYPNVDVPTVWDTIQDNLPGLIDPLRQLLASENVE